MSLRPVIIMAGGTGGHIFPGLAVADYLREKGVPVTWLGGQRGLEISLVPKHGYVLEQLDIKGLRGKGLLGWLSAPFKLTRSIGQAWRILRRHRPGCVISMGGYAAGPGGLAARLLRIPLLVHEQNRVPGLTNRILAKLADQVFEGFPGTFPAQRKVSASGNPVRAEIFSSTPRTQRSADQAGVKLLVTGGSQGARRLNQVLPGALQACQADIKVWHQCGSTDLQATTVAYARTDVDARVSEFIDDMAEAYAWADLIICRAGALTVAEVCAAGLPAIFVPYPHAVDDHQTKNAEYLAAAGAALIIAEAELNPELLAEQLQRLLNAPEQLADMAQISRGRAFPEAAARVAQACMEYCDD